MVFKAEQRFEIPNKDLTSLTFDDNKFEQDEPVSHIPPFHDGLFERVLIYSGITWTDWFHRDISMPRIPRDPYHSGKQKA